MSTAEQSFVYRKCGKRVGSAQALKSHAFLAHGVDEKTPLSKLGQRVVAKTSKGELALEERTERLDQSIREQARDGWWVESRSPTQVVVWALVAAFGGNKRQVLSVDARGVVYSNR